MDQDQRGHGLLARAVGPARAMVNSLLGRVAGPVSQVVRTLSARFGRSHGEAVDQSVTPNQRSGPQEARRATDALTEVSAEPVVEAPSDEYDEMTKAELYRLARDLDIRGRGSMSKAELIAALRA